MKKRLPILLTATAATAVLAVAAWMGRHALSGGPEDSGPAAVATVPRPERPPDSIGTDPATVFQKAFWRRPTPQDRILHAERREWTDGDGLSKWQWFLAVEPSPELVKYLREDNAFGLIPAGSGSAGAVSRAPAWFPEKTDGFDILQNAAGTMTLLFSKTANQLYATDSGGGFRPAIAVSAPPPRPAARPATPARGRLPLTPPPNPSSR
ncbi:MAG: hypothetical protein V4726_25155 [Verrucomicrobiota bacterium]